MVAWGPKAPSGEQACNDCTCASVGGQSSVLFLSGGMMGSGKGVKRTVRLLKPHWGKSGVPFMNSTTGRVVTICPPKNRYSFVRISSLASPSFRGSPTRTSPRVSGAAQENSFAGEIAARLPMGESTGDGFRPEQIPSGEKCRGEKGFGGQRLGGFYEPHTDTEAMEA